MLTDITLGQFFPGNSILHKLDPRTKLIMTFLFVVAIFTAKNIFCFALLFAAVLVFIALSGISYKTIFKGLKPIVFVVLFTMILNVFLTKSDTEPLFQFKFITVYEDGIWRALYMAIRVIILVIGTSLFISYTTSPIMLTDAIETMFSPLKKLKIPVHEFAMMMSIALRFIPTLIEETDKIMNAQKARGADFANGSLIKRAKALIPVLVPLFVSSFKRAEDLAMAMECRCYRGGKGRTRMTKLQFKGVDFGFMFVFIAIIVMVLLINIYVPLGYTI